MFDTREDEGFGIALENVGFSYGDQSVLEHVTFEIPKGEVWALVGRSGCGKTTLLHVVAGLFRPSTGRARVAARDSLVLGRIRGVVFQDESLLGWLSVEDNVLFPRHRIASADLRHVATDMLTAVGLADYGSWYPSKLSTGMRKRLEFARALVADQEYILADEPFGTVDALTRRDLWRLWKDVRARVPRTGLFATHDPEEAVRLCDAVVILQRGKPGKVGGIIKIPASLRELSACQDEPNLLLFKEKIIESLGE